MRSLPLICLLLLTVPAAAAQNCDPEAESNVVLEDFDIISANLVIHTAYEVMWRTCPVGQDVIDGACQGDATLLNANDAEDYARSRVIDGLRGWRLPRLEDFELVLDTACTQAALSHALFPDQTVEQVWTASPGFPVNDVAAVVDVQTGKIWGLGKGVERKFFVVRDGPPE